MTSHSPRPPLREWLAGHDGPSHDRANNRRVVRWSIAWAGAYLVGTWLLEVEEVGGVLGWLVAVVPVAIGVVFVTTYLRFLRDTDEFVRAAQLDGAAIGLAVGVSMLLAWALAEPLGAPRLATPVAATIMLVSWAIGQCVALLRYR